MVRGDSTKVSLLLNNLTMKSQHKNLVIAKNRDHSLTKCAAELIHWTTYSKAQYNFNLRTDASVLQSNQSRTKEPADLPVLLEEVERACTNSEESEVMYRCQRPSGAAPEGLRKDNKGSYRICQKMWEGKAQLKECTQSLVVSRPKKRSSEPCQTTEPQA